MNSIRWLSLSVLALTASCRDGILLGGDAGDPVSLPPVGAQGLDASPMDDVATSLPPVGAQGLDASPMDDVGVGGSTCWIAGQTYEPGEAVPTALGVPIDCTCTASGVQCTPPVVDVDAEPAAPSCVYYGAAYDQNTSVPSGDGNSTCCCLDGLVICLASLGGAATCVTDGLVGGQPGGIPMNPNFYTCAAGGNDRSVFVPNTQGAGYVCDGELPAGGDGGR